MTREAPTTVARISVELQFTGNDLDFDACAARLNIEPTRVWRQREALRHRTDLPNSQFAIGVEGPYDSIDEPLELLMARIWPQREAIRDFVASTRVKAGFTCIVRVDSLAPEYCLEPSVLGQLAWFSYAWCLSIYDETES